MSDSVNKAVELGDLEIIKQYIDSQLSRYYKKTDVVDNAMEAVKADTANLATEALSANTAGHADTADEATNAGSANIAEEAVKAYKDGDGNVIKDTYLKKKDTSSGSGSGGDSGSGSEDDYSYMTKTETDALYLGKEAEASSAIKAKQDIEGNDIHTMYVKKTDIEDVLTKTAADEIYLEKPTDNTVYLECDKDPSTGALKIKGTDDVISVKRLIYSSSTSPQPDYNLLTLEDVITLYNISETLMNKTLEFCTNTGYSFRAKMLDSSVHGGYLVDIPFCFLSLRILRIVSCTYIEDSSSFSIRVRYYKEINNELISDRTNDTCNEFYITKIYEIIE